MSYWLKSEEGKLINLAEATEIRIDENGWKIKTYQLCADNNLIKKFDKKENAEKSLDFLFDVLCGSAPNGSLDFSKEVKLKEKVKDNQRGIQLKEVENGETGN